MALREMERRGQAKGRRLRRRGSAQADENARVQQPHGPRQLPRAVDPRGSLSDRQASLPCPRTRLREAASQISPGCSMPLSIAVLLGVGGKARRRRQEAQVQFGKTFAVRGSLSVACL